MEIPKIFTITVIKLSRYVSKCSNAIKGCRAKYIDRIANSLSRI